MGKILILTSYYYPKPDANGVCTHEIAKSLVKSGHSVHVVGYRRIHENENEILDDIKISRVKIPFFKRVKEYSELPENARYKNLLYKVFEFSTRLNLLLHMPFYPITSFINIIRYFSKVDSLYQSNRYDLILTTFKPIDAIVAGILLKKKYNYTKLVLYILDSFPNSGGGKYLSKYKSEKKGWKWEQRIYPYSDLIINMKCHENYYIKNSNRYSIYANKMEFADFPLIKPSLDKEEVNFKNNEAIYTGNLDLNMRNPQYACKIFSTLQIKNLSLNFYSAGNCEQIINEYKSTSSIIKQHGFVSHSESIDAIKKAKFLVNIGNNATDMVPSKLFEYISTGKPIIHFYYDENDSCLPYLSEYPLSLIIKMDEAKIDKNRILVSEFIESHRFYEPMNIIEIESIFKKNTPKYTTQLIERILVDDETTC